MHCMCTRTDYAVYSWAWPMVPWPGGVEQDFLEVPPELKLLMCHSMVSHPHCRYLV